MNVIQLAEGGYETHFLHQQHPNIRYDIEENAAYAQEITISVHGTAVALREYNHIPAYVGTADTVCNFTDKPVRVGLPQILMIKYLKVL